MWSHQRLFRQAMLHCSEPSAINLSVLQADWPTVIVIKVGGYQMVTSLAESIHVQMPDLPEQNSSGGAFCESCVSSAYFWKSHPWSEIVSDRGWEQNQTVGYSIHKGLGADTVPSTKPNCGILHTQGAWSRHSAINQTKLWDTPYTRGLEQTQCQQQQQTDCSYGHGMQTTQATLKTVKVTRRMEWSSVLNACAEVQYGSQSDKPLICLH